MYQDKTLVCRDCRQAHKAARNNGTVREMHDAICANCGAATKVPFQPREDRPVYCSECYAAMQRK